MRGLLKHERGRVGRALQSIDCTGPLCTFPDQRVGSNLIVCTQTCIAHSFTHTTKDGRATLAAVPSGKILKSGPRGEDLQRPARICEDVGPGTGPLVAGFLFLAVPAPTSRLRQLQPRSGQPADTVISQANVCIFVFECNNSNSIVLGRLGVTPRQSQAVMQQRGQRTDRMGRGTGQGRRDG